MFKNALFKLADYSALAAQDVTIRLWELNFNQQGHSSLWKAGKATVVVGFKGEWKYTNSQGEITEGNGAAALDKAISGTRNTTLRSV